MSQPEQLRADRKTAERPRVVMYSQHSLGLGHLVRTLALAGGLTARFDVVVCSGGPVPGGLAVPPGVDLEVLSPVGMDGSGGLASLDPSVDLATAWRRRRLHLMALVGSIRPSAVVVELFPFGRRKFAGEILALIAEARRADAGTRVVCSVRDLLVTGHAAKQDHDDEAADRLRRYFDAVIVHADSRFAELADTFRPQAPLGVPVHYSGFVTARTDRLYWAPRNPPEVIVSAGGGAAGRRLFEAAIEAHRDHLAPLGWVTRVVSGPFAPAGLRALLAEAAQRDPTFVVESMVGDLCREIATSTVSVSQCGYNTAIDLMRAGAPSVIVPYDDGGETEQTERGRRLEALGLTSALSSSELGGRSLAKSVLAATRRPPPTVTFDLDGAAASADIISRLVDRPGPDSAEHLVAVGAGR